MKFDSERSKAIRANYRKTEPCECGCGRTAEGGNRKKWFSNACKQKAYRKRKGKS